jgi:hypothetical protein
VQPHKSERRDEPWRHRHNQRYGHADHRSLPRHLERIFGKLDLRGQILAKRKEMATAGTVMLELKLTVDGKYFFDDILVRLRDLHKQATVERSHYYTGRCISDAINEIARLGAERNPTTQESPPSRRRARWPPPPVFWAMAMSLANKKRPGSGIGPGRRTR